MNSPQSSCDVLLALERRGFQNGRQPFYLFGTANKGATLMTKLSRLLLCVVFARMTRHQQSPTEQKAPIQRAK